MTSPQNSFSISNWKPYPTEAEWLSGIRLILPVASGIYGRPNNQIAITSNHQPSLVKLGKMDGFNTLVLNGGGFPLKVAVAFNLLKSPPSSFKIEYVESMGENITFHVPYSLSVAWNWRDGEMRLGGTVKVVSDNFSESDSLPVGSNSALLLRLYTALRLALAQIMLMAIPVSVINLSALIPVILVMFLSSLILAGFWNLIPGSGWGKGVIAGLACVGIMAFLGFFQIILFSPIIFAGVFIAISWLGVVFMGANSSI